MKIVNLKKNVTKVLILLIISSNSSAGPFDRFSHLGKMGSKVSPSYLNSDSATALIRKIGLTAESLSTTELKEVETLFMLGKEDPLKLIKSYVPYSTNYKVLRAKAAVFFRYYDNGNPKHVEELLKKIASDASESRKLYGDSASSSDIRESFDSFLKGMGQDATVSGADIHASLRSSVLKRPFDLHVTVETFPDSNNIEHIARAILGFPSNYGNSGTGLLIKSTDVITSSYFKLNKNTHSFVVGSFKHLVSTDSLAHDFIYKNIDGIFLKKSYEAFKATSLKFKDKRVLETYSEKFKEILSALVYNMEKGNNPESTRVWSELIELHDEGGEFSSFLAKALDDI